MLEARIIKLDKLFNAKSREVKMFFIDSPDELTKEQIDSKSEIYVYMEI